ncbi:sister chromatid cohesion protein Dcc1 [Ampelomyces quisqualis]|uniref:Sister chromatid cohesion protein Dcc1 n=1 Tax=Ampelomyces quisqualis TaxID=50730 RepID=A0A6A5QY34_AMPQU|nr:sister chromatid cohesion protein Dcc1 [Ampelomyces quisqualis]
MATAPQRHGCFSIAHDLQRFRLLELPPDLVQLLDAPNPPRLSLKSQPEPAYAVLCTPAKTYQLRQVQTSNSLFITQPALESHGNAAPAPATRAIASCTATLELHPADPAAAVMLLRRVLPVYDMLADHVDATAAGKSMAAIFDDMPFSDAQCLSAWHALMAFEHQGSSYQPSARALSHVWSAIHAAALAEGVKLDCQFLTPDITKAACQEDHPPALVGAILSHLAKEDHEPDGPWSCLDRTKTVAFAGRTLLDAKRGSDFLLADFIDIWEDRLPEAWRGHAQLDSIPGAYEMPTSTTIRSRGSAANLSEPDHTSSTAPKPSARKWHDKFAKTRKK